MRGGSGVGGQQILVFAEALGVGDVAESNHMAERCFIDQPGLICNTRNMDMKIRPCGCSNRMYLMNLGLVDTVVCFVF